jgi:hypothetical protein
MAEIYIFLRMMMIISSEDEICTSTWNLIEMSYGAGLTQSSDSVRREGRGK